MPGRLIGEGAGGDQAARAIVLLATLFDICFQQMSVEFDTESRRLSRFFVMASIDP